LVFRLFWHCICCKNTVVQSGDIRFYGQCSGTKIVLVGAITNCDCRTITDGLCHHDPVIRCRETINSPSRCQRKRVNAVKQISSHMDPCQDRRLTTRLSLLPNSIGFSKKLSTTYQKSQTETLQTCLSHRHQDHYPAPFESQVHHGQFVLSSLEFGLKAFHQHLASWES
jgi:hypothetical protein